MATYSPYIPSGMNADAIVINPALTQNTDSTALVLGAGRAGEQLVSDIHGKYGVLASRGGVFMAAATTAAIAVPINTTTSGSTFAINNPAGSGKNVELIRFNLAILGAGPGTANIMGFSIVPPANATSAITKIADPVTAGGHATLLGGAAPQASVCSAITFASALTVAANWGVPMFWFPATWQITAAVAVTSLVYDFAGSVLLPPGWTFTLTASTAWAANTVAPSLTWAEYLV